MKFLSENQEYIHNMAAVALAPWIGEKLGEIEWVATRLPSLQRTILGGAIAETLIHCAMSDNPLALSLVMSEICAIYSQ